MRTIDADALIEELNEKLKRCGDSEQWDEVMEQIERVKNQPTIDAVPVVRCKDCKYWSKLTQYSSDAKPIGRCAITSTLKSGDGYCEKAAKIDEVTP